MRTGTDPEVTGAAATAGAGSGAAVWTAYAYGLAVAVTMGHFLLGIPIQLSDCFGNMLKLDTPWAQLMENEFTQRSFLRPFLFAELKLVYDASGGHYFAWFRGTQVVQVAAVIVLYLALVRPRTWRDTALVPLGLAMLVGIHTFKGAVVEAFPINTFLTIVLCCLAAANLALMQRRWWVDVLAVLLFVVSALTVESGLLVAVIFIGAALVGARGVSWPGLAAIVALLAGYFVLRFNVLEVGSPGLIERSSGYGFRILDPPELIARFGDNPSWFYAYNIATSALSVLFSEPRAGAFGLVYGFTIGNPYKPALINLVASTCATLLIGLYVRRRWSQWWSWRFDRDDRLVWLFFIVLAANATISYPYTKDVIMSPAGAFFAVAAFAAARGVLPDGSLRLPPARLAIVALFCAVLAVTWSLRAISIHLQLRETARKVRTEWAYAEDSLSGSVPASERSRERILMRHLQDDAVVRYPAPPRLPIAESLMFEVD
jgi:hypothetical protein